MKLSFHGKERVGEGSLDLIPIHIDSALASQAMEVFRRYTECYDEEIPEPSRLAHGEENQPSR